MRVFRRCIEQINSDEFISRSFHMRTRSLIGYEEAGETVGKHRNDEEQLYQGITDRSWTCAEDPEQKFLKSTSFGSWEMRVRVPSGAPKFSTRFGLTGCCTAWSIPR
jgi:hypothetical protein